eukprot:6463548-Amphidinium_carterae.1
MLIVCKQTYIQRRNSAACSCTAILYLLVCHSPEHTSGLNAGIGGVEGWGERLKDCNIAHHLDYCL